MSLLKYDLTVSVMKKNGINFDEVFKLYYRPLCLYAIHYVRDVDIAETLYRIACLCCGKRGVRSNI